MSQRLPNPRVVSSHEQLISIADQAREKAFAPYSEFTVGAAIKTEQGTYHGANIEVSGRQTSIHAEAMAIFSAVMAGASEFSHMVVSSARTEAPCGLCQHTLTQFTDTLDITVVGEDGESESYELSELTGDAYTATTRHPGNGHVVDDDGEDTADTDDTDDTDDTGSTDPLVSDAPPSTASITEWVRITIADSLEPDAIHWFDTYTGQLDGELVGLDKAVVYTVKRHDVGTYIEVSDRIDGASDEHVRKMLMELHDQNLITYDANGSLTVTNIARTTYFE
ncbi:cytidine deaminase family protein [Halosegnis longus]|uniref:cytidine deaminase family protein n=1 Tax=Halosegnis longus TaxID=2216012 RepID=UPI00129D8186|nr:hypothetical protein [Halosegnis longus]